MMPLENRRTVSAGQWHHPNVPILKTDNTEIIDFISGVRTVLSTWTTSLGLGTPYILLTVIVKSLHVHLCKLAFPLHDIVDTMQIVFRSSNEDTFSKEVTLENMFSLRSLVRGT
jgi:hypothetical protein